MKKKLLILTNQKFGYQTDYYNWCFYLRNDYDITYLAYFFDINKDISLDGVTILYSKYNTNFIKRELAYYRFLRKLLKDNNFDNVIVTQQFFAFLLRLFLKKQGLIFDIRSVPVMDGVLRRFIYNVIYKFCTVIYPNCSGISIDILKKYQINKSKFFVLPLGANVISQTNKSFDKFDLLYIGVIRSGFESSVLGFKKFLEIYPDSSYTIIGNKEYGKHNTVDILKQTIEDNNLKKQVRFLGRLDHTEAKIYFDKCNIGISYIPINEYYDNQPPTKNYEYFLSGMPCLATGTNANKRLINKLNGVIIEDNADSFFDGLKIMKNNKDLYNSSYIRNSNIENTWETIVKDKLAGFLEKIRNY